MLKRLWNIADKMLVVAAAYFVTGWLGLLMPAVGSNITLVWLPTGIAVASLLRWGTACWPAISLAAFAVNLSAGVPWPAALGVVVGNTLSGLFSAWLLRRMDFHPAFDRKRDILLLAVAAVFGSLIAASGGVTALSLAGVVSANRMVAWFVWWAGDTMGVILAAPLGLALTREGVRAIVRHRAEFAMWLGTMCVAIWMIFFFHPGDNELAWDVEVLPLPLVAWAALRFGAAGTSLALIALCAGVAVGTATGRGPFQQPTSIEGSLALWIFMATSAVLGWLISALHTARRRSVQVQQLFEQALSDVSLGVLLAGLDRRITYVNHGFTRLTGYTEAEVLGKNCTILQGPETDPETLNRLKNALYGDGFFDGEVLNYRKDGTSFWNGLLISPVRDERGVKTGFLGIQRDVTARRQAEVALHQSEEHLRTIIELEPECVKLLAPDGTLLEMNPAGLAMIEAESIDQVRGHPIGNLIVPEDRAAFAEMHRRVLQGATGHCEFAIVGIKGARRFLETNSVPYRNARREIIGVLGITRDVTHRKEAAADAARSLTTLQLFINTVPAYISYVDAEGRYRLVNKRYEDYFGVPAERLVGQRLGDVQPPAAYAEMQPHIRAALGGETVRYQSHPTGPDGRSYWLDVQYVPRLGAKGAVDGFFVLVFDITENKKAEEALRESEERFRRLIDYAPEALVLLDVSKGHFVQVNPAAERLFKFSAAELCKVGPMELSPPNQPDGQVSREKGGALIARAMAGETPAFEWTHRDAEGRDIPCEVRLLRIEIGGRAVVRGSITDITARQQAEQLDRKMQETQKLESLGVLAGGIAHDFNNLLTSILGNASIATMELPPGSSVQDCLEQITEASLRAADLCKQMLAYSGRGRFIVQRLDLGQLVEQTAQMLQISISKKAVLRFRLEKGLPPIEVDATQMRQVIMNLVINASEAIGDRSGVISLTTGLARVDRHYLRGTLMDSDLPEGEYVFLEVSDSGCGMSPETQARIFDPFFTTKFTGRGLGLAAVLGIVRGHQGALKVYSEVGRGTTFKLLFPAAAGAREEANAAPPAAPAWHGEGTVLVVDDEETMRSTVARMMRKLGLEPVLAIDGREAVEVFRADPARFALVLLDLTMPHMDGEQTFTELRRLRPDVRVVLMSGFNAQEALVRFSGKGLASFLQKPFRIDSLREVMQAALG